MLSSHNSSGKMGTLKHRKYKNTNMEYKQLQDKEDMDKTVHPDKPPPRCRQDITVFLSGLIFICGLIGAMYGLGIWRDWDAPSGYSHDKSPTSGFRFSPEPSDPEAAGRWYYWKLKKHDVTVYTRLFVWLCYSGHQLLIWAVLYLAQFEKSQVAPKDKYSTNLSKYSWISFGLNIGFHLLHLLQTHTTYDATAQDVSIASSQSSVIMLLIYVILLEYNERGALFGWPTTKDTGKISKKLRLNWGPVYLTRKYHGYAFAWASVYTFWYHPMENTYGHALGFFHTWILMLQGSLMYTDIHKNRYWRFVLEAWVALHGSLVAVQTGAPDIGKSLWPMFLFGFTLILVLTWIFIFPFWEKIPFLVRFAPVIIWVAVTIGSFSAIPDSNGQYFVRLQEVIRMPAFFYPFFFLCWLVLYFSLWIERKCSRRGRVVTKFQRGVYIFLTLFIYVILIVISSLVEILDLQLPLFAITVILVTLYCVTIAVTMMLLKQCFFGLQRVSPSESIEESKEYSDKVVEESEKSEHVEIRKGVTVY